ncbi:MAG: AraC family transcriptional regulator [Bacteroidota bacterium]|jgi:AraC-like DNA-binding protein|nr:AraC family transcriptional regulator [Bacteroidota bacterium]
MIEIVLSSREKTYNLTVEDPIASAILVTIDDFIKDYHHPGTNKELLVSEYLKFLVLRIDRAAHHHATFESDDADQRVFQKFIGHMERELFESRKISYYCKHLGVSPRKLSLVCHEFRGQSAKNILDERLLNEVKYLLLHTTYSIKYISSLVGFSDQYQFSKYFKKHLRVSPTRYREVKRPVQVGEEA